MESLPALDNTLGALYIGNIVSAIIFGINNILTYSYFTQFPKDKLYLKVLVVVLWIADTLHLILSCHEFYTLSVTNYANPVAIGFVVWSVPGQIAVTSVSDCIVRGLFAHRVWIFSGKNKLLVAVIAIATLVVLVGGLGFAVRSAQIASYTDFNKISWILFTSFISVVVADVLISTSLVVLLKRRGTAFNRTRSIIRTLILYSINTSALTSICAIVTLVTFATMRTNFVFHAIFYTLPKLYIACLLTTLNARAGLRGRDLDPTAFLSIPLSSQTAPSRVSPFAIDPSTGEQVLNIQIEMTTDKKYDNEISHSSSGLATKDSNRVSDTGDWAV